MAHVPPVHEEVLLRVLARGLGLGNETVYRHQVGVRMYLHQIGGVLPPRPFAEHTLDTLLLCAGWQLAELLVVVHKGELHLRINQHYR